MKIIFTFIAILGIAMGLFYFNHSKANINTVTFVPTTLGVDDVAGLSDAHYNFSYSTDSVGTVSFITATFQSEYALQPLHSYTLDTVESCNGTPGNICINGVDQLLSAVSPGPNSIIITLNSPFDYSINAGNDTVSFKIVTHITNPTVAGAKSASAFTIEDDSVGNSPVSPASDVTIIAGTATQLVFTTLPSDTRALHGDTITSGVSFETQPVVTAEDAYGNTDTTFAGYVAFMMGVVGNGHVTGSPVSPPCLTGNSGAHIHASSGVATWTDAAYIVGLTDHEGVSFDAVYDCGGGGAVPTSATTGTYTTDVVADSLVFTQAPDGCVSGSACSTQGIVQAGTSVSIGKGSTFVQDTDYVGSITFGSTGLGMIVGTNPQSMTGGTLTTVGLGYGNVDPTNEETIDFTADGGSLTQGITADTIVSAVGSVLPPTASPAAGEYKHGIKVSLSSSESATHTIRYTINGSAPGCPSSGTLFSTPVTLVNDATIKAITCVTGSINTSSVQTFAYTFNAGTSGGGVPSSNTTEVPGNPGCTDNAALCPPGAPSASVVGTVPGSPVYGAVLANNTGVFTHDLFVGTSDTDVTALQQFLVGKGYLTMPQGVAFGYFGNLTKAAVSSFQKAVGVTPTLGYFGAKTRAKVDAIAGNLPQGAIPTNTLPSNATLVAPSTGQAIEVLSAPTSSAVTQ